MHQNKLCILYNIFTFETIKGIQKTSFLIGWCQVTSEIRYIIIKWQGRRCAKSARSWASGAPIMRRARASKKTTSGPSQPFFKGPNLNNNAVTRESIRKMRSTNFVSKFHRVGFRFHFLSPLLSVRICVSVCRCLVSIDILFSPHPFKSRIIKVHFNLRLQRPLE